MVPIAILEHRRHKLLLFYSYPWKRETQFKSSSHCVVRSSGLTNHGSQCDVFAMQTISSWSFADYDEMVIESVDGCTPEQIKLQTTISMSSPGAFTVLDPSAFSLNCLIHKHQAHDYGIWQHPLNRKEYCEYILYGEPNQNQLDIYQFRKDQSSNLVSILHLSPFQNAGFKQFKVFVERTPVLLSDIERLSFLHGLYVLREALIGFQTIYQKYGYVRIDEKFIGFNNEGKVKVWMNQNFAYNGVAITHLAPKWMNQSLKQKQMISSIFSLVEQHLQKGSNVSEFKRERERELRVVNLTFRSAIEFVDNYALMNRVVIPQSAQDLVSANSNREDKIIKSQNKIRYPLSFKKRQTKSSRKTRNNFIPFAPFNLKSQQKLAPDKHRSDMMTKTVSPQSDEEHPIRARNESEATMSVYNDVRSVSQWRTVVNHGKTRYFSRDPQGVQTRGNLTLQSSLISRDLSFKGSHLQRSNRGSATMMPQFRFVQAEVQRTKTNNKKRKSSAADQMTLNYASKALQRNTALSLAKSMMLKDKPDKGKEDLNPETVIEQGKYDPTDSRASFNVSSSPARDNLERHQLKYKMQKPFLNYKAIKNSIMNQHQAQFNQSDSQSHSNLKNSFLNRMEMKNSEIIYERSEEETANDILKAIREVDTPNSRMGNYGFYQGADENSNKFLETQCRDSATSTGNGGSERKSSSFAQKKEGLMSITSPRVIKSGMFKSILVDMHSEIKEDRESEVSR